LLGSALAAAVLFAASGGEANAGGPGISAPQAFSGSVGLTSIACVDAGTCYVIGNGTGSSQGTLFTLTDGAVTNQQPLGQIGTNGWKDIACWSGGTCYAIGVDSSVPPRSLVLPIVNGTPGTGQTLESGVYLGGGVAGGIACGPSGACYAVGGGDGGSGGPAGVIVPLLNGRVGKATSVPGTSYLFDIDCPTADTCYAVGNCSGGVAACNGGAEGIVSIVDGQPGAIQVAQSDPTTSPNLTAIACPNADDCYATGSLVVSTSARPRGIGEGAVVASVDGQPGAFQTVAGTNWLYAMACPTSRTCFALGTGSDTSASGGSLGIVVPITDGVAGAAMSVDVGAPAGTAPFVSGDCPSAETCYGLSSDGIVPIDASHAP